MEEIKDSEFILSQDELNKLIDKYNSELSKFNELVSKFNFHYEEQIMQIRKMILQEIIVITEKYAKNNNVDLILDSTNYIIASNKINVTEEIRESLNLITIDLEFKSFD